MVDEIYQGLVYGLRALDRVRPAGRGGADQQLLEVLLHDRLAPGLGGAAAGRGARLREARAAPLHQRAGRRPARRARALFCRKHSVLEERRSEFAAPARLPGAGAEEGRAGDPGRAARRVLRLCRLRRRRARALRATCWRRKAWPRRRGWISAPTAPSATCASPTREAWRTWRRPLRRALARFAAFRRLDRLAAALEARASRRAPCWRTGTVGSSSAPAYICSAVSVSPKRRWYSRRICAPTWMLTCGLEQRVLAAVLDQLLRVVTSGSPASGPWRPSSLSATGL